VLRRSARRRLSLGERRKIERHPRTGAAQLVEIHETVREIEVLRHVETQQPARLQPPKRSPFTALSDEELLSYGAPPELLNDARDANEDRLLGVLSTHPLREEPSATLSHCRIPTFFHFWVGQLWRILRISQGQGTARAGRSPRSSAPRCRPNHRGRRTAHEAHPVGVGKQP